MKKRGQSNTVTIILKILCFLKRNLLRLGLMLILRSKLCDILIRMWANELQELGVKVRDWVAPPIVRC